MNPQSRSFKMLLALNKAQKDKLKDQKRDLKVLRNNRTLSDNNPDTVNDPDYNIPSDDSGSETSETEASKLNCNRSSVYNLQKQEEPRPNVIILSNVSFTSSENKVELHNKNLNNSNTVWQESTVVSSDVVCIENESVSFISEILQNIIDNALDKVQQKNFTKKGEIRKRKKFDLSPTQRKKIKISAKTQKHNVKQTCKENTCKRQCIKRINMQRRVEINREFWKVDVNEQKNFILHSVSQQSTKRKTTDYCLISRRSNTYFYFLKDAGGSKQNVCKTFFLGTLGYDSKNDRVVRDALNKTNWKVTVKPNLQGKHSKMKFDRDLIIKHIDSFRPTIAHYRREHAPERRYLPSDINITMMYNNFRSTYPNIQFSYYLYREVVSSLKISFVKLGHEECWVCESFELHSKLTSHKKDVLDGNCDECKKFASHRKKYTAARKHYQEACSSTTDDQVIASADLQKVIMLPRMEMFKEVMFTPRIIAFNESFVITRQKQTLPTAVIWHEAISGRSSQDITSTFYAFLLSIRDARHVTLWLDNCSSQNKNWTIFTFFVHIVNSAEVSLESLRVKYFEPGHTFMGADSFHHQVERCLKRKGKVYDFKDFSDAVKEAASNVKVINMCVGDFYNWENGTSQYKLNKISPRPYLNEMVEVTFLRGKQTLLYKTDFDAVQEQELNFLNAKMAKQGVPKPSPKNIPRGITVERRDLILSKLCTTMPMNRKKFWEDIPISTEVRDLDD